MSTRFCYCRRLIHDKGFSDVDKTHYRNVVRANLATSLLRVLEAMRDTEYAFTGELVVRHAANSIFLTLPPSLYLSLLLYLFPPLALCSSGGTFPSVSIYFVVWIFLKLVKRSCSIL